MAKTIAAFPDEWRARRRAHELQQQATNGTVHLVEHDPWKEPYAFRVMAYERTQEQVPQRGDPQPADRRIVFVAVPKPRGRGRPRNTEKQWEQEIGDS